MEYANIASGFPKSFRHPVVASLVRTQVMFVLATIFFAICIVIPFNFPSVIYGILVMSLFLGFFAGTVQNWVFGFCNLGVLFGVLGTPFFIDFAIDLASFHFWEALPIAAVLIVLLAAAFFLAVNTDSRLRIHRDRLCLNLFFQIILLWLLFLVVDLVFHKKPVFQEMNESRSVMVFQSHLIKGGLFLKI